MRRLRNAESRHRARPCNADRKAGFPSRRTGGTAKQPNRDGRRPPLAGRGRRLPGEIMQPYDTLIRSDNQQPVRCLIVDDSVFARKNLARLLREFGCDIAGEASDGCAALAEYDRVLPDLVLMDITMPRLEGIEAAERMVREHQIGRASC